jgi:hypothetical protein
VRGRGEGRLPDFLVIGAAKAGTTALHEYLRQHPEVAMSRRKEPNFFVVDGEPPRFGGPGDRTILNRDLVWRFADYQRQFASVRDEQAVGEVSPRYLSTPGTAERIHRRLPEARLVAVLRQPAERAWSHFMMRRRDGFEPRATLEEAIADEPRRVVENWASGRYLERGFYAAQLAPYLALFPRERLRIYLYDDLVADPGGLFRDLFDFLGVDPGFVADTSRRPNPSGELRNPLLRWLWTRTHGPRERLRPLLPKALRARVSRWVISRPLDRRPLPAATRRWLTGLYADDVRRLEELLGRDLSAWLDEPAAASSGSAASRPSSP